MLDTLITSRVRRKIIFVYAKYPDYKTHIRGLSTLIKEDVGNVYRELRRLEKIGFLMSSKKSNTKIYSANKQFSADQGTANYRSEVAEFQPRCQRRQTFLRAPAPPAIL